MTLIILELPFTGLQFSGDGGLQVLHRREKCVFIDLYISNR